MADAAGTTPDQPHEKGFAPFLVEAVSSLYAPTLRVPVALLVVILTLSNIVILYNVPEEGGVPSYGFLVAAFVRVGGILVLGVAILRILVGSERYPWRPDGAFWLYALVLIVSLGIASLTADIGGAPETLPAIIARNVLLTVILSPFVPWIVGIAAATPLGWNPARFLHHFSDWLPPLLAWSLLLVTPMAILHAAIDLYLLESMGTWFWPLLLLDGPLSAAMALLALALNANAYRRVARR
jgi:hypothetical protein